MKQTFKELYQYIIPFRLKIFIGLVLLFVSSYLMVLQPKFLKETIDEINRNNIDSFPLPFGLDSWFIDILPLPFDMNSWFFDFIPSLTQLIPEPIDFNLLYTLTAIILGIMLVKGVVLFYARYIITGLSRVIEYNMRNKLFRHLLFLDPKFYDGHRTGDLISRLTSDMEQVRLIFGPGILYTFNAFFLLALAVKSMSSINLSITLYAVIPLILMAFVIKKIGLKYYEKSKVIQEELANMTTFVNENFQGIRVIKAYAKEGFVINHFNTINLKFIKENLSYAKYTGLFRPVLYLLVGFSSISILLIGGQLMMDTSGDNAMQLGTLMEMFWYIEIISIPLMALGWVLSIFQRGSAAYHRIRAVLIAKPTISEEKALPDTPSLEGTIEFKNLSFSYDDRDNMVLENISFSIKKGEKIAIIGPTGSGKTTLVSLLLRLYQVSDDTILINDVPIEKILLKDLRNHFGYVAQENFIFPETIMENIKLGSYNHYDESQIAFVTRLAEFEEEIESFPKGYDELVGEQGITLSGGQRQRLGIARALSGEPSVFIFDDAFSNIDSQTERKILDNIHEHYSKETVIIIAHRASTIQNMDKIVVLDHGKIIEMGSPEELIKSNGYYAHTLEHERISYDLEEAF